MKTQFSNQPGMKAKVHRIHSDVSKPPKRAPKRASGSQHRTVGTVRPSLFGFFRGVDEDEALAVGESLDERENKG